MSLSATMLRPPRSKFLSRCETVRITSRAFRRLKRARTASDCCRYEGSSSLGSTISFMVSVTALSSISGGRGERALPRKDPATDESQNVVDPEAKDADHGDGRIDVRKVLIARLLRDEPGNARSRADQLRDDQVSPGPTEQDALIAVQIRQDAGDHDAHEQLAAARTEREGGLEQSRIELARGVGDDQHLLEKRADHDYRDLRSVVDAENRDGQCAEVRRRQVAEELDERLVQARDGGVRPAQYPDGHAQHRGDRESPEDDLDAVPQTLMQPLAIAGRRRRRE